MNWNQLNSLEQWNAMLESEEKFIVFKHSTRCSISRTALSRFERDWVSSSAVKPYYLDLLEHRNISNAIAAVNKPATFASNITPDSRMSLTT